MSTQGQWRGEVDGVWFGPVDGGSVVNLSATLTGSCLVSANLEIEAQLTDTHDGWWAAQHKKPKKKTEQEKAQEQLEQVIEQAVQAVAKQKPVVETDDDDLEMLMMLL